MHSQEHLQGSMSASVPQRSCTVCFSCQLTITQAIAQGAHGATPSLAGGPSRLQPHHRSAPGQCLIAGMLGSRTALQVVPGSKITTRRCRSGLRLCSFEHLQHGHVLPAQSTAQNERHMQSLPPVASSPGNTAATSLECFFGHSGDATAPVSAACIAHAWCTREDILGCGVTCRTDYGVFEAPGGADSVRCGHKFTGSCC